MKLSALATIVIGALATAWSHKVLRSSPEAQQSRLAAKAINDVDSMAVGNLNLLLKSIAKRENNTNASVAGLAPQDEFMKTCLDHTNQVIGTLDKEYSDDQALHVLSHECHLSKKFPEKHDDGFESDEACFEFAKKLTEARRHELDTGSDKGYVKFCQDYYVHKGGEIREPEPGETTEEKKAVAKGEKEEKKAVAKGEKEEKNTGATEGKEEKIAGATEEKEEKKAVATEDKEEGKKTTAKVDSEPKTEVSKDVDGGDDKPSTKRTMFIVLFVEAIFIAGGFHIAFSSQKYTVV